ncbi:hypothetical protein H4R21_006554, partial [Coemansia helicoidea]
MRRMSKAPQLIAQAPDEQDDSDDATAVPVRATTSNQQRLRSLSLGSSRLSSTQNDAREDDSDASADGQPVDDGEADAGELARLYHDAAATQRSAAKTHAVEPWRFISPRVKRVKRRVLWRLFLAQELTPAVYDEASVFRAASATSSPVISPQTVRGGAASSPRHTKSHAAAAATAAPPDSASLRRHMLEQAAVRSDAAGALPPRPQHPPSQHPPSQHQQNTL